MSIIANNKLISEIMDCLKDSVSYASMGKVMQSIENIVAGYEIVPIRVDDEQSDDIFIDAYIDALRVEGRSEKTLYRYKYVLNSFLKQSKTNTKGITQYHIRKFLSDEKARGIADSTIRGYCWIFSAYFGWLHRDGIIQKNPMGNIGKIKVQKKIKEVFSEVEIEKLKMKCKTVRDKAIIMFIKSTCCRISEVTSLNRDDIDFKNLECVVLGKGNKQRSVYLDAVTAMILQEYLASRKDDNPALFVGQRNERLLPGGVRYMLHKTGERASVENVHPHKFRRTEITELASRGMPIEQIKTLAGHEKIDTTMGYIKIDQQNVKNSYRKYA